MFAAATLVLIVQLEPGLEENHAARSAFHRFILVFR